MKERPDKNVPGIANANANSAVEIEDRRAKPRRAFIAEALVVELASGARLSGRCCDLVAHGCYMDTINPFQQGTLVRIRLQHGSETAEAKGTVVYRVPNLGMGISFFEIASVDQAMLDRWILQASQEPTIQEALLPPAFRDRASMGQTRDEQIVRLIQILQKKRGSEQDGSRWPAERNRLNRDFKMEDAVVQFYRCTPRNDLFQAL